MWVILYLSAVLLTILGLQSVIRLAMKQPLEWSITARSDQPRSLKMLLKVVLQANLIGSIFLFPYLVGSTPGRYYGALLPPGKAYYFLYGEGIALVLLTVIYGTELACGWLKYQPRWSPGRAFSKSALSAVSSLTVVGVEEPFFRGIILHTLLLSVAWPVAIPLSAVLFSAAHFVRRVRTYWPAAGLAVLGLWLGVAFYKTGNLWLSMGLHSGGILSIGIHRCFLHYRGKEWVVGTQTFPIAGAVAMGIMLVGTVVTWVLFS